MKKFLSFFLMLCMLASVVAPTLVFAAEKTVTVTVGDIPVNFDEAKLDLLADGNSASDATTFSDAGLVGFENKGFTHTDGVDAAVEATFEIVLDLGEVQTIGSISLDAYKESNSMIALPSVDYYVSVDGENYYQINAGAVVNPASDAAESAVATLKADFSTRTAVAVQYVKAVVTFKNGWVFLSELSVGAANSGAQAIDELGMEYPYTMHTVPSPGFGVFDSTDGELDLSTNKSPYLFKNSQLIKAVYDASVDAYKIEYSKVNPWPDGQSGLLTLAEGEILIAISTGGTVTTDAFSGSKWIARGLGEGDWIVLGEETLKMLPASAFEAGETPDEPEIPDVPVEPDEPEVPEIPENALKIDISHVNAYSWGAFNEMIIYGEGQNSTSAIAQGCQWWLAFKIENIDGVYTVTEIEGNGEVKDMVAPADGFLLYCYSNDEASYAAASKIGIGATLYYANFDWTQNAASETAVGQLYFVPFSYGENIALGKPVANADKRPSYNADLTDGVAVNVLTYNAADWFGYYWNPGMDLEGNLAQNTNAIDAYVGPIVDLGGLYDLTTVRVNVFTGNTSGICAPESITLKVSADGEIYEEIEVVTFEWPESGASKVEWVDFKLPAGISAQYVQLEMVMRTTFVFINEIEVYGTEADAPVEPEDPVEPEQKTYENTLVEGENGNYSCEVPYGYTWNVDYIDGTIGGEDVTIVTTQDAYNACNPNWAITVYLEKQEDGTYVALKNAIVCPGSAANAGISIGENQIALVAHSSYSNPNGSNWMGKVVAMAVKAGDVFVVDMDAMTVYAVIPGEEIVLPETPKHNLVHIEGVDAGCHYDGVQEHWYCTECETVWADEALTIVTNHKNVIIPALGGEIVHVDAVAPTTEAEGNIEYWYCEECEQVWQDEALTQLTNFKNVILPKLEVEDTEENIALDKNYTYSGLYPNSSNPSYPDEGGTLTDGITYGEGFGDPVWVGFNKQSPEYDGSEGGKGAVVTIDLGTQYDLTKLGFTAFKDLGVGITVPYWANIYVSADGASYEFAGYIEINPDNAADGVNEFAFDISGTGRYVQVCLYMYGWGFVSEIEVFGTEADLSDHEHNLVHIEGIDAGCHYDGVQEHWYCTICDSVWADEALTIVTNHKNVIIPAVGGDVVHVDAVAPTYTELGNIEYWYCEECEQVWQDEALTQLTNIKNVVLPTLELKNLAEGKGWYGDTECGSGYVGDLTDGVIDPNGEYDTSLWYGADKRKEADGIFTMIVDLGEISKISETAIHTWPAGYSGIMCPASIDFYVSVDGETFELIGSVSAFESSDPQWVRVALETELEVQYVRIDMVASDSGVFWFASEIEVLEAIPEEVPEHNLVHIEGVDAGCHYDGVQEHWYCTICDSVWADEALTIITNHKNVIIPALGGDVIHVDAVAPTYTELGNIEYWYCEECEQVWQDEALTQLTNIKNVVLPMLELKNLALGLDVLNADKRPSYNADLTDGVALDTLTYNAADWFGFYWNHNATLESNLAQNTNAMNGLANPTIDLGDVYGISSVRVNLFVGNTSGIAAPESVTLKISADGITYETIEVVTYELPASGTNAVEWLEFVLPEGTSAQFVCLEIDMNGTFVFLNEIEVIEALPEEAPEHNLVHVEGVDAGCHYEGVQEHWYCTECETVWADEALTIITNHKNVIIPALGGEVVHVEAVAPSCMAEGNIEYWYCEECEQVWQDEALTQLTNFKNVILGTADHEIVYVEGVDAGCHYDGVQEHWYCTVCDTVWADEALTQITNRKNVIIPELGGDVIYVEAVAPTYTELGNIEYWYCEECEQVWQDEARTQLTNFKNVILPTLPLPNLAEGKGWYGDTGSNVNGGYKGDLTDGVIGTDSYDKNVWFNGDTRIETDGIFTMIVDLGKLSSITETAIHVWPAGKSGIAAPVSIDFYASEDGETFELIGSVSEFEGSDPQWVRLVLESAIEAQYIRIDMVGTATSGVFWFASEIEVIGLPIDILYGDVNGDGEINGMDATRLLKYLANVDYASGECDVEIARGADVNGDGVVDGRDSVRLLRYLAEIVPETGASSVVLGA